MKKCYGDEVAYGIHEVYYVNDVPEHWTENPTALCCFPEDGEVIDDLLKMEVDRFSQAIAKPILNWEDGKEL